MSTPSAGSMEDMEQQTLEAKLQVRFVYGKCSKSAPLEADACTHFYTHTQPEQTLRAHRDWKCNVKWEALNEHAATWRQNGLANLDYEVCDGVC